MRIFTSKLLWAVLIIACSTHLSAQKISVIKGIAAAYASKPNSNENAILQQVHNTFKTASETTVIDFTSANAGNTQPYRQLLKSALKTQTFFAVNNAKAYAQTVAKAPPALTVIVPYKNKTITIDMVRSEILTSDFTIATGDGKPLQLRSNAFYKGVVRDINSVVSVSLYPDHIEGYISIDNKKPVEITKLRNNESGVHVVYSDEDLLVKGKAQYCSVLNTPQTEMIKAPATDVENPSAVYKCITNFWETSYNIFQYFGSVQAVLDYGTCLFNTYSTIYAKEQISMKLAGGKIWTTPDPYNDDLSTFSNLRRNFNANLAMLLSNSPYGGVAWLNTVCQSGDLYRHAYCGSILSYEQVLPITSYTWPVMVTAHEVGHNLSSPHTHDCAWNGNNTAIDGCGYQAGYGGCNGPIPQTGGTVMSYCHLLSNGINLTKGFGEQPGNLIRGTINSCITATCASITLGCPPPANVKATNKTSNSALISWNAVPSASYYYIYISADGGNTFTLAKDYLNGTSFQLTGLIANTTYLVDVWVACATGTFNSTRISFKTATALQNRTLPVAFSIQPNPVVNSSFSVVLDKAYQNAVVEIVNMNNQIIQTSKASNSIRTFTKPKTGGMYYARIINGNEIITQKFLVE